MIVVEAVVWIMLLVVGFTMGLVVGRSLQRQEDRARRQEDPRRNPDVRPRYSLLAR